MKGIELIRAREEYFREETLKRVEVEAIEDFTRWLLNNGYVKPS